MAYSFRYANPQLAGVIIREKVRCGRPNCRCAHRNHRHGWYYYLYWRDRENGAILRKRYIRRSEVKKLRQKIRIAKFKDKKEKMAYQSYMKLFKQFF
jgi:hypothetical protein